MNGALGVRWDDLPLLRDRAVSLLLTGPARTPVLAERVFAIRHGPSKLAASLVEEVLGNDPRFQVSRDRWLLRDGDAGYGALPLDDVDFVVVDVEATGGSPARGDRMTEVAAVRVHGGRVVDSFESLINPDRPIPPSVSSLTEITDAMVANAPRFFEVAGELRAALEGAVFVAHNASFDWRMLEAEFRRCGIGRLDGERLCTLRLARRLHPELAHRSLRALVDYYALPVETWHRAGPDARATADLFLLFLRRLADEGIHDWACLQTFLSNQEPDGEDEGEAGEPEIGGAAAADDRVEAGSSEAVVADSAGAVDTRGDGGRGKPASSRSDAGEAGGGRADGAAKGRAKGGAKGARGG